MQCEICHRPPSSRLPFHCTLCARTAAYQPRLALILSLLEKESIEKEVEQSFVGTQKPQASGSGKKGQDSHQAWAVHRAAADQKVSDDKHEEILDHIKTLRAGIQHMKLDIAKRKAVITKRRKEMASARQRLSECQSIGTEPIEKDIGRTVQRWISLHQQMVDQRILHCTQAARLYSLQQHKRRKGAGGNDMYSIGFTPIPDLRELNNASPSTLTTSLTHVANLVYLVSHHLSLKLPAEITLPHSDYPLPTILSPNVSYSTKHLPFPGTTPSHSSHPSPTASRHLQPRTTTPRPRPLYLKKKLSSLAKDDPLAYAYFVEGITLLAWDIAWLCKTQGLNVGQGSWEEVCAMGNNLWQLFLAPSARPLLAKQISGKNPSPKDPLLQTPKAMDQAQTGKEVQETPAMGDFSHGTAYGFLAGPAGNEYMREWRLQNPVKVIDKVKAMLLAERTGAEWEILQGNEWEGEEAERQATEVELGKQAATRIEETGVLVRPMADDDMAKDGSARDTDREDERARGTSGWMKVKSR